MTPRPELAQGRVQRSAAGIKPLLVFSGIIAAAILARLAIVSGLPLPQCWLRKLTGIPCPSCGCTRSLLAWLDGEPGKAFRFNPLFFICCIAVLLWLAVWVVERVSGRPVLAGRGLPLSRPVVWKIGLALVALNWLYLCLTLPK